MKKTDWMNCRESPPIHVGWYEVRLWEPPSTLSGFTKVSKLYFDGKYWCHRGHIIAGKDRPGWHKKDEWRGVLK